MLGFVTSTQPTRSAIALVGKFLIDRLTASQFRQIVLAFMTLGGIWMIVGQLQRFALS